MDRMFSSGLYKSLQLHSQIAPTYSAIYAYQGRNSLLGMAGLNYKELGKNRIIWSRIYNEHKI
jgi:hypothetical protein